MEIKITKRDVLWGYTAQFFNIGVNVLILPFILRLLPVEILGIWYVFLSISAFVLMLDFGFQPTFARNVAYVMSGATRLKAEGVDEEAEVLDCPNYALLKNIIKTMRRFYGYVSLAALGLMLTVGTWYVFRTTESLSSQSEVLCAWFIFVAYTVLNLFYSYYNALLVGKGQVKEYNQMTIVTKLVYLLLAVAGLLVFVLNNLRRNVVVNIGAGLWDTYNMVTGLLGDVLSYIRLFALGISGSVLGLVFNDLAMNMSGDIPVLKQVIMLVILLFGHGVNLFMSGLGAFVHPMRLTFVEFYKNSGFEGGGKKYNPLRRR